VALVAATVPAGFTAGFEGTAQAQSSGRGGGGGGGGGGGSMANPVLKCLGAACINVSQAQVPPCTANYCKEEEDVKHYDSCEVRVCKLDNGRKNCRIEVSYDERICIKHQNL
jgi:hypothetical protein